MIGTTCIEGDSVARSAGFSLLHLGKAKPAAPTRLNATQTPLWWLAPTREPPAPPSPPPKMTVVLPPHTHPPPPPPPGWSPGRRRGGGGCRGWAMLFGRQPRSPPLLFTNTHPPLENRAPRGSGSPMVPSEGRAGAQPRREQRQYYQPSAWERPEKYPRKEPRPLSKTAKTRRMPKSWGIR